MTMLLDDTSQGPARPASGPTALRPRGAAPLARRPQLPTAALLRLVDDDDGALELVPAGIALHVFTEPIRERAELSRVELHRATTVLTKQVKRLLTADGRLDAIAALATDPDRPATPDGRTAATLCGRAWPAVRDVAAARCAASIEGAAAFGETAILRLAATRAAVPACRWWGTNGWVDLVDRWSADHAHTRRLVTSLARAPELVSDEILDSVLDR